VIGCTTQIVSWRRLGSLILNEYVTGRSGRVTKQRLHHLINIHKVSPRFRIRIHWLSSAGWGKAEGKVCWAALDATNVSCRGVFFRTR